MQLRDYQRRTIDGLYSYFEVKNGSPLLVLPTGAGKSVIIAALCKEILETWTNQRLMILSHVGVLLQQNLEKLHALWPQAPAGLYCAGLGSQRPRDPITVGSIQSVYKKAHIFGWRDLVLIDEAHLLSNDSGSMYRRFLAGLQETNPRMKVIGLTATPYRMRTGLLTDGDDRLFTDIAAEVTLQELLEGGYISPLVSKSSLVQADLSDVRITAGEFNTKDAEAAMDKEVLTAAALDEVFALASDRRSWLFFCAGVRHAEHVRDALRLRGVTAECITGDTVAEERDRIIAAYKQGEVQAITNANVLTTGFDAPNIDLIAVLRPTMSPGLWVQMLGRGLRLSPDKRNCLVLDFTDTTERLGPIDQIRAPKAGSKRQPTERHQKSCLICPVCRMVSPLGSMECAECGHTFARPERIRHDTEASTAEVMVAHGDTIAGADRLAVKQVSYDIYAQEGVQDIFFVGYHVRIGTNAVILRDRLDFEGDGVKRQTAHAWLKAAYHGEAAKNWWAARSDAPCPKSAEEAYSSSATLRPPVAVFARKDGANWKVVGHEFESGRITMQQQTSPTNLAEWLDVEKVEYFRHEKEGKPPTLRVEYVCGMRRYKEWICLEHPEGYARGKAVDWWKRRWSGTLVPDNVNMALSLTDSLRKPYRIKVTMEDKYWRVIAYDLTGWTLSEDRPAPQAGDSQVASEPIDFCGDAA